MSGGLRNTATAETAMPDLRKLWKAAARLHRKNRAALNL